MTINEVGLPQCLVDKESTCNGGDTGDMGSILGSGISPQRSKQQPIPIFLPEKFHEQRSLESYSPKGHKESDTTEQLSMHINGIEPLKVVNHYIVHLLLT